ncbi:OmpA domain protein [Ketogulonicigenium robustum]|uniref:OmpA domain protein n=1 Tax=Ketogulonicigenium robustum TaxID=92947 RepID=A0A1W6NX05_9RHOB|nr:OmpA family protein [Ketogulonicigenium robustum]ARO13745.1 OmpA domain protein [Ketogulonicigenium robustum]
MALPRITYQALAFVAAAGICAVGAGGAVVLVERSSAEAVTGALQQQGMEWATVLADGLQVVIEGEAPNEVARLHAMSAAATMVDGARVVDNMSVRPPSDIAAPVFSIEMLRNEDAVSLIGLIPSATDRAAIVRRISGFAPTETVTDLLNTADYPVPENWNAAVTYAFRALQLLPRSKVSVGAGRVSVSGISESTEQQAEYETTLSRWIPNGVVVDLNITAPRPVLTPFTLRFRIDDGGIATMEACSADSDEARASIIATARAAGLAGNVACTIGLGSPSSEWARMANLGISALAEIAHEGGSGTLTMLDTDVRLAAAEPMDQAVFDRIIGRVENSLPATFSFAADMPPPVDTDASAPPPPQFYVSLNTDGQVILTGRTADELLNASAGNFARAHFGANNVIMATRVLPDGLPQGWSLRVLAGIEALSHLHNGNVLITPDTINVRGMTGEAEASNIISQFLIDKLGQGANFNVNVEYIEALDPTAGLPEPAECVQRIIDLNATNKIAFDPGSAQIAGSALKVIDDIADVLRGCPADLPILVAGYTDSQGRDEMNLRLSQDRADAVLSALRMRRVPVSSFTATGFGEADPIASNDTEEGREANRRIAFSLIVPEGEVTAADTEDEAVEDGADTESTAATDTEAAADDQAEDAPTEDATEDAPAVEPGPEVPLARQRPEQAN